VSESRPDLAFPPPHEGKLLGEKWTVEGQLGEGGAGTVYRAHGVDGRAVAVKMLHPDLAHEPEVRARFMREAYVANTIEHAGAVRVFEDGVDDFDVPYLVMELLEGETYEARRVRKGGRLGVDEVLWAADNVLSVLVEAHRKGIVHRDIKPENLFLTTDRRLKVLDFGIARLADRSSTYAGAILGTLAFMPPEQARGAINEVGVQSDLWSVGATMYTLLSGRLVREDGDPRTILRDAGRKEIRSLGEIVPDLPADVVDLVDAALPLDLKLRWPNAKGMRRAVCVVHAAVHRASSRPPAPPSDDEDAPSVREPSFGVIGIRSIAPPPSSVFPPPFSVPALPKTPSTLAGARETLASEGASDAGRSAWGAKAWIAIVIAIVAVGIGIAALVK
jgi:serine/threonine-protein kinase